MYTFSFGHVITVPPDDEGWLCPGCDCKVYCVDLLNNLLGTDLSITDSWEKVFQEEAAAAASGKQLDDMETFGIASSDSSDKDCEDNSASKNKRKRSDKSALKSSNQSLVDTTVKNASRTSSKKRKAESLVESECASSSKRNKRLKHGDDVIKRLSESFKENHYPKREVKESLAKELGLTVRQVSKWFVNRRCRFNPPSPQAKNVVLAVEECVNVDSEELPLSTQEIGETESKSFKQKFMHRVLSMFHLV